MQFDLSPYVLPESIDFNYEQLKAELLKSTEDYKSLFYSESQMKQAKEDRAKLNKLKKALNDERIRIQKEYLAPFDVFKGRVDELIGIIGQAVANIDSQVKAYEDNEKAAKKAEIEALFQQESFQPFVKLEMIWNPKWLNKSVTLKQIADEMATKKYAIGTAVSTLYGMENGVVALEHYKKTLDLNEAIRKAQEHAQMQKLKAEAEKAREEVKAEAALQAQAAPAPAGGAPQEPQDSTRDQQGQPLRRWARFEAFMTMDEAVELVRFFKGRGIEYRNVPAGNK